MNISPGIANDHNDNCRGGPCCACKSTASMQHWPTGPAEGETGSKHEGSARKSHPTLPNAGRNLRAGDRLVLKKGKYDKPLIVSGWPGLQRSHNQSKPTRRRLPASVSLKQYTKRANLIAMRRQAAGYYPSVGQTADEAVLAFIHCKHLILRGSSFPALLADGGLSRRM